MSRGPRQQHKSAARKYVFGSHLRFLPVILTCVAGTKTFSGAHRAQHTPTGASWPNLLERFSSEITDKRIRLAGKGVKT